MTKEVERVGSKSVDSYLSSVSVIWESLARALAAHFGNSIETILMDIRLAITEVVTNVIRHAHSEDGRPMSVTWKFARDSILIQILDTGPGMEWPEDSDDPPDIMAEGGRGFFLIEALMDHVAYDCQPEGNCMILVKSVPSTVKNKEEEDKPTPRRVLVADDDDDIRFIMKRLISKMGYEVITASDGAEALAILTRERHLDAALLDVMMPKMDGLEVVRSYRDAPQENFVPIILVTAKGTLADVVNGLDAGANEYIVKPPHAQEVASRLRAAFRLRDMAADLRQSADQLKEQLREARNLQMEILPPPRKSFGDVVFSSLFRPCDFVGGDMVGYFEVDPDTVVFYVADVSGHGVPAAMFSMWLNRSLQPVVSSTAIVTRQGASGSIKETSSPSEVCTAIDGLMGQGESEKYLTMFYGVLTLSTGELTYCCAGHPAPFLLRCGGGRESLEGSSPPLGMGLGFDFSDSKICLNKGDQLFAFSDCAVEAMSPDRDEFGFERLGQTIEICRKLSPDEQLQAVLAALRTHRHAASFEDDLTLLSIHV